MIAIYITLPFVKSPRLMFKSADLAGVTHYQEFYYFPDSPNGWAAMRSPDDFTVDVIGAIELNGYWESGQMYYVAVCAI